MTFLLELQGKTSNRPPDYHRTVRFLKRAFRRRFPRRLHPLLDAPVDSRGADEAFAAAYGRAIGSGPESELAFVRERYREGIRWRQVVGALAETPPRLILDLGAGNGAVALAMTATGGTRAMAVDTLLNGTMRTLFRATPHAHQLLGDGAALPLRDGSIDAILCLETIEHVPPGALPRFAHEMARVLRRDGLIVITTPPRWRYLLRPDPHFGIPALLVLPPALQRAVAARRGFDAPHHYVGKIVSSVRQVAKLFPGFSIEVLSRSRAPRRWFWDALVLRRWTG
jgi:SAM-dependent methyltransferase